MSCTLCGVGWDVGGWQGTKQATSVALLSPGSSKIDWLGISEPFSFTTGVSPSLMDLLEPAVSADLAESINHESCCTIAIDAPLAFPKDLVRLIENDPLVELIVPAKEIENTFAYRECEKWINDVYGKKPLSATFDKLGNNATLALTVVANLRKVGFSLIPQDVDKAELAIIEVYPALLKTGFHTRGVAIPEIACHMPGNVTPGTDPYDAALCAIMAILYQGGFEQLETPRLNRRPKHFDPKEGWIFNLQEENMPDPNPNDNLHEEFTEYINDAEVRDAYHVLIGAAASLEKFNCYSEEKGAVRDFRFYTMDNDQPFAFIINKRSLLFYLRSPAIESKKYNWDSIKQKFDEINENTAGEWTIRVNNRDDAVKIIKFILLIW